MLKHVARRTHSIDQSRFDAVVIGGGHNGLVAAAYLAQAGLSVMVLERQAAFGGASVSQRIFPAYDAMLSRYSYLVSLFPRKIIDDLELTFTTRRRDIASFTPWIDAAGNSRGLLLSNTDEQRSRDSMYELTGKHADWERYLDFMGLQSAIAKLIWPTLLQPLPSRADFESRLQNATLRRAWDAFVERPLGEAIEAYADHDALRGLLLTDAKIGVFTHAHDPSLLQNRCFLYHVIGNETGEWRVPVGGMQSLVEALLHSCRRRGVVLQSQATALHVDCGSEQREVTYECAGRQFVVTAEHVLINAGPSTFCKLLQQPRRLEPADEGSVIKMNMLLQRLPKLKARGMASADAFTGSLHVDEGYQQLANSYGASQAGRIPQPAPGEVYCHTLTDPSILSPELQQRGFHTLTLFGLDMPWRLFESAGEQRRSQVAELYLQGLDNLCVDSFRECLAVDATGRPCLEIKSPQDLETELGLDQGNIFHNALTWFWGTASEKGSWGVETEFPGIYRAGSSALRGGAVSGIPGHNAAMCVLRSARR